MDARLAHTPAATVGSPANERERANAEPCFHRDSRADVSAARPPPITSRLARRRQFHGCHLTRQPLSSCRKRLPLCIPRPALIETRPLNPFYLSVRRGGLAPPTCLPEKPLVCRINPITSTASSCVLVQMPSRPSPAQCLIAVIGGAVNRLLQLGSKQLNWAPIGRPLLGVPLRRPLQLHQKSQG